MDISIYVACLASYNHGTLFGKWIDATQDEDEIINEIKAMLESSPIPEAEEWAIFDYEGFGNIELSEYESIEAICAYAQFIEEHDKVGIALLADFDLEEAQRFIDEAYCGSFDSEVEFAESLYEDCYSGAIPDNLLGYFDFEAFSRDLFINDYFSIEAANRTHVFFNY